MNGNSYYFSREGTWGRNKNMDAVYQQMWHSGWPLINANQVKQDPYLNGNADTRRGITLLARIKSPVCESFSGFLAKMQQLEPEQYYYPMSDMHVTVLSVLSCQAGYQVAPEDIPHYVELIQNIVNKTPCFNLEFKGITLADSGVIVCGYVADDSLAELRAELRQQIGASALAHSMDLRYTLVTAHSTVCRFRRKLRGPKVFAEFLQANQELSFGNLTVTELELVVNDWYQCHANTQLLANISLLKP